MSSSKYKVLKQIGKGGFGITKLVQDKTTGKKYIRKQTVMDKSDPNYDPQLAKANMDYQVQMLKELKKKGICNKFICPKERYVVKGETFFIMDFLEGYKDLDSKDVNIKSKEDKKKICADLIQSVELLHRNDIVHTDLKPPNVMINPKTKEVKIIDFGTAIKKVAKKRTYDVIGYSEDYTMIDLSKKSNSWTKLKDNDMLCLGLTLIEFLGAPRFSSDCSKSVCSVDKDFFECYHHCKKVTRGFDKKNFLEVYQLMLKDYLGTRKNFFSKSVYDPKSTNFQEMNERELNLLKNMKIQQ